MSTTDEPRRPVGYSGSHRPGARELAEHRADTLAAWANLRASLASLVRRKG